MLDALIRLSLARRAFVLAVAAALLFLGVKKALELPVDVLPDLTKPTVILLTEAPGHAPEEVETLVTIPLENTLMGVSGVNRIRSTSDVSLSLVFIEFEWGSDIYQARQLVQERLSSVRDDLPEGIRPHLMPVTSLMGDVMLVGLRDPTGSHSPRKLRTHADWVVGRRLLAIPGIAEVQTMGGGVRQLQVRPDPEKMLRHDINYDQLRQAAANSVKNTTGGFLDEGALETMGRNLAMTADPEAIGNVIVKHRNDRPVRIADVAEVLWDAEPMRGDAGLGHRHAVHPVASTGNARQHLAANPAEANVSLGSPGVILSVRKSPGFDTLALTAQVEQALDELQASLPPGAELLPLYRQADYIDLSIGNLVHALRDGGLMVALVLLLFLLNLRVTLITLTAIPLSLAITALIFDLFDLGVNSMTLGGVAVAIGMVVDDAIVDVENVFRRLRENATSPDPLPKLRVIAEASSEVRSSIFYATLLIILVFLPLFSLQGLEGRLFAPIATATIVSMAASFLVSLTVIPVLCSFLLQARSSEKRDDAFLLRLLKRAYSTTWLRFSLAQPIPLLVLSAGLLGYAVHVFHSMGGNFLPPFREPSLLIATTTAPGTSLKTSTEIAHVAQERLLRIPGIKSVGFRAGRAEKGDHVVPVSSVEFDVEFDDSAGRTRARVVEDVRAAMAAIPGTFSAMNGPLSDRVGHMLSGVSAKIAVKTYGPELPELRRIGEQITAIAHTIPALKEARMEQQATVPQLRIEVDRRRALAYGITPGRLNEELAALLGGEKLTQVYEDDRKYDLALRLPPAWRENPERLKTLHFHTQSGQRIPLGYIADVRRAGGPNVIKREHNRRRLVVSANPLTGDLTTAVETLRRKVAEQVKLPPGYDLSYEGEYLARQDATRNIILSSTLLLLFVAVLLHLRFRSFTLVLLVLGIIPLSLIGGVLLSKNMLGEVSVGTLVGLVAVAGIAARNNVMLLTHYLHLMSHEGESFGPRMIARGSLERLSPILMTALSAGIALLPFVFALNPEVSFLQQLKSLDLDHLLTSAAYQPGKEILAPVATVIVGGLVSSTLLGLGLTPALFLLLGRKPAERLLSKEKEIE